MSTSVVKAICWTLVHSLWQGLLLAIAAALVVVLTKNSKWFVRYNVLSSLFLLFVIGAVCTFCFELNQPSFEVPAKGTITAVIVSKPEMIGSRETQTALISALKDGLFGARWYLDRYAFAIVIGWVIVLALTLVKICSGPLALHTSGMFVGKKSFFPTFNGKEESRSLKKFLI